MASNPPPSRFHRVCKLSLKAAAVFFALILTATALAAAVLPYIGSTEWARQKLCRELEAALGRPVRIEQVHWRWSDGIIISRIAIWNGPRPSGGRLFSAEGIELRIDYSRLWSRSLAFSLRLENPEVHLILGSSGRLNLPGPFADDAASLPEAPSGKDGPAQQKEKLEARPLVLPLDIEADIRVSGLCAAFENRLDGSRFALEGGEIRLAAPSLAKAPISWTARARLYRNGQRLPDASMQARVHNLFDADRKLRTDRAAAELQVDLPGARLSLAGDLAEAGMEGEIGLDLAPLCREFAPFLPKAVKENPVRGKIDGTVEIVRTEDSALSFRAGLRGRQVSAARAALKASAPLSADMEISVAGRLDTKPMHIVLRKGRAAFLDNTRIAFEADLSEMDGGSPLIDFAAAPVEIDFGEVAAFARSFPPAKYLPAKLSGPSAALSAESIRFRGRVPKGTAICSITGLRLSASEAGFQAEPPSGLAFFLQDGQIRLSEIRLSLTDLFPTAARIHGKAKAERLAYSRGDQTATVEGFSVDDFRAAATGLKRASSIFPVSGRVHVDAAAGLASAQFSEGVAVSGLRQQLDLSLGLAPDGTANGTLRQLRLQAKELHFPNPFFPDPLRGASLELSLAGLSLIPAAPLSSRVESLQARIRAGGALDVDLHAGLPNGGRGSFDAEASARMDIDRAVAILSEAVPPGLAADGKAALFLSAAGRFPDASALAGLKKAKIEEGLSFLKHFQARLSLSEAALEHPRGRKPNVRIAGLSADPLLAYEYDGETASGRLEGRLTLEQAARLFTLTPDSPVSGTISLALTHQGTERISAVQTLTLSPAEVEQSIELSLEGLQAAFGSRLPEDAADLLEAVAGRAAVELKIGDAGALRGLNLPGTELFSIDGRIETALVLEKQPNNSAKLRIRVDAADVSAEMADRFAVGGVNSRIELAKTLQMKPRGTAPAPRPQKPEWLSEEVMQAAAAEQSAAPPPGPPGAFPAGGPDWRRRGGAGISMASARINAGPLPLELGATHVSLGYFRGLPWLPAIQIDVLGGTILGDCRIRPRSRGYSVLTRFSFTGLDAGALLPHAGGGLEAGAAEISGSIFADIPLAAEMERILEQAKIRICLQEIGPRALERMLYALDPHESSEAIVGQRKLLQTGTPRRIDLLIKDGFLSLEGEITVKSAAISMPPLERLNLARIPGIGKLDPQLSAMPRIIRVLDMASANALSLQEILQGLSRSQ